MRKLAKWKKKITSRVKNEISAELTSMQPKVTSMWSKSQWSGKAKFSVFGVGGWYCGSLRCVPLFIPNKNPLLFLLDCPHPRSVFASIFSSDTNVQLTNQGSHLFQTSFSNQYCLSCKSVIQPVKLSSQSGSLLPACLLCLTSLEPSIWAKSPPLHHYCSPAKLFLDSCYCNSRTGNISEFPSASVQMLLNCLAKSQQRLDK